MKYNKISKDLYFYKTVAFISLIWNVYNPFVIYNGNVIHLENSDISYEYIYQVYLDME